MDSEGRDDDEDYVPEDEHGYEIPLSDINEFGACPKYPLQLKRHKFTQKENEAITKGIAEYGKGQWALIKDAYPVALRRRTAIQIKDRSRTMAKQAKRAADKKKMEEALKLCASTMEEEMSIAEQDSVEETASLEESEEAKMLHEEPSGDSRQRVLQVEPPDEEVTGAGEETAEMIDQYPSLGGENATCEESQATPGLAKTKRAFPSKEKVPPFAFAKRKRKRKAFLSLWKEIRARREQKGRIES